MNTKILVVDDHAPFREAFRKILQKNALGEEIFEADNGDSAIQMTHEHHPDLIFMDIAMPKDGFTATEAIHQQWPEIKIIILTAHATKSYQEKAFDLGAVGFLVKKSVKQELVDAFGTIMNGDRYISRDIEINSFIKPRPMAVRPKKV